MNFFWKSFSTTAGRIVATGCQFLTIVLVAAFLGAEAQGQFAFLILIPTLACTVLDFGLSHANLYLLGRDRFPPRTIFFGTLLWSAAWGAVVIILWQGRSLLGMPLDQIAFLRSFRDSPGLIHASIAATGLVMFFNTLLQSYLARDRVHVFNLFAVGRSGVLLVLVTVVLGFFHQGVGAAFGIWWGCLLAAVVALLLYESRSLQSGTVHLGAYFREALGYGGRLYFAGLAFLLMYRLDHFFVMHFRGSADLGRYHLATQVAETFLFITGPLYWLTIPRTAKKGEAFADRETPRTFRMVFWALVVAMLPLYGLFRILLAALAMRGYVVGEAASAFAWLLPGIVFLGVDQIISGDLAGRGRQIWNTIVASGMLLVNVALDLWWIPRYGVNGAAAATSFAYIAGCLITLGIFLHFSDATWRDLLILRREDLRLLRRRLSLSKLRERFLRNP